MRQHLTRDFNYKKVEPILFGPHTGTRDLEEAIWTIICADLDRDAAVATHRVAFFTKEKSVQRMKAVGRRREMRWRRRCRVRETWTVIVHTRWHRGQRTGNLPATKLLCYQRLKRCIQYVPPRSATIHTLARFLPTLLTTMPQSQTNKLKISTSFADVLKTMGENTVGSMALQYQKYETTYHRPRQSDPQPKHHPNISKWTRPPPKPIDVERDSIGVNFHS